MTNPNDPAFPLVDHISAEDRSVSYGLTKREYFAAMAMQGIQASGIREGKDLIVITSKTLAHISIEDADALIAELNKGDK